MTNELFEIFLQDTSETLSNFEQGLSELRREPQREQERARLGHLGVLAHRLRGTTGLYGYPQLSALSALGERLLEPRALLVANQREEFLHVLSAIATTLRAGLQSVAAGQGENQLGLQFAATGTPERLQALLRAAPRAFEPPTHTHYETGEVSHDAPHENEPHLEPEARRSLEKQVREYVADNAEVWSYFAPEVREHLEALRTELDKEDVAPQEGSEVGAGADISVMFRAAHTIKGSSYMVGFAPLGDFGHTLEDVLSEVREGRQELTFPVRSVLGDAAQAIEQLLQVGEDSAPLTSLTALSSQFEQLQARLSHLAGSQVHAASYNTLPASGDFTPDVAANLNPVLPETAHQERRTVRVDVRQLDGLMERLSELIVARARLEQGLGRLGELQQAMHASQERMQRTVRDFEERYLNPDMVRLGEGEAVPSSASTDIRQQFDELEFDTYNDLNILARSITELSADFSEVRSRFGEVLGSLQEESEQFGKLTRRLRLDVSRTSRQPFSQATARLRRWARQRDNLELIISGEQVEVENTILQRLTDPLLHLLTNAATHALETPQERRDLGKIERGQVRISASEQGNFLEIKVEDDGRGLNLSAIRDKALVQGLRSAQELHHLSSAETARLILLPGLSTATHLTAEAGRGVGMDVVASSIKHLGGELMIDTLPQHGTRFTLRLPTSQRIADILPAQVGSRAVGFLLSSVQTLREMQPHDYLPGLQGHEMLFEGKRVPVIALRAIWGLPSATGQRSVVVLRSALGLVAAEVDSFGSLQEVAVSPAGALLGRLDYLAGFSVAASGGAIPLLDPAGLVRLAAQPHAWLSQQQGTQATRAKRALLVDDSMSVRRVVSRMLERGGYQVQAAADGQEALESLQQGAFDVVLTDLEMPRMNGYELLEALRARRASAELPVIVMTTRAGEKHQRLAFQLGASDYFSKPVDESLLLRRMNSLTQVRA